MTNQNAEVIAKQEKFVEGGLLEAFYEARYMLRGGQPVHVETNEPVSMQGDAWIREFIPSCRECLQKTCLALKLAEQRHQKAQE